MKRGSTFNSGQFIHSRLISRLFSLCTSLLCTFSQVQAQPVSFFPFPHSVWSPRTELDPEFWEPSRPTRCPGPCTALGCPCLPWLAHDQSSTQAKSTQIKPAQQPQGKIRSDAGLALTAPLRRSRSCSRETVPPLSLLANLLSKLSRPAVIDAVRTEGQSSGTRQILSRLYRTRPSWTT